MTDVSFYAYNTGNIESEGKMHREKYYTPEEVAERLNVSTDTVRRYISQGLIKASKLGGVDEKNKRHWRIKQSDLDLFMERSS